MEESEAKHFSVRNRRSITLIMRITHYCDKNCAYCYDVGNRKKYGKMVLSHEMLYEVIDKVSKNKDHITLIWHGGEPTSVGIEWFEKAQYVLSLFDDRVRINQLIQTNGSFLNDDWFNLFNDYEIQPGLSCDYFSQYLRDTEKQRAELTSERSLRNALKIMNSGAITVVTKHNQHMLTDYYTKVSIPFNTGLSFLALYEIADIDMTDMLLDNDIFLPEIRRFLETTFEQTGIVERMTFQAMSVLQLTKHKLCHGSECRGMWIGVGPDGGLAPCDSVVKSVDLGFISDYSEIDEVFESEDYLRYVNIVSGIYNTGCTKCEYFNFCHGGCTVAMVNNYNVGNFIPGEAYLCKWYRPFIDTVYDVIRKVDFFEIENKNYLLDWSRQGVVIVCEALRFLREHNLLAKSDYNVIGIKSKEYKKVSKIIKLFRVLKGDQINIDQYMIDNNIKVLNDEAIKAFKEARYERLKSIFDTKEFERAVDSIEGV